MTAAQHYPTVKPPLDWIAAIALQFNCKCSHAETMIISKHVCTKKFIFILHRKCLYPTAIGKVAKQYLYENI